MGAYFERIAKLEKVYSEVVEKFPRIKKEDIVLEYNPFFSGHIGLGIHETYSTLIIGPSFFEFNGEEQKANIAHELGHYNRAVNGSSPSKIKRIIRWCNEVIYHDQLRIKFSFYSDDIKLNEKKNLRIKRIQKWDMLCEICADKEAAKAGYGIQLLASHKRVGKKCCDNLPEVLKKTAEEQLKARIESLEKILGGK